MSFYVVEPVVLYNHKKNLLLYIIRILLSQISILCVQCRLKLFCQRFSLGTTAWPPELYLGFWYHLANLIFLLQIFPNITVGILFILIFLTIRSLLFLYYLIDSLISCFIPIRTFPALAPCNNFCILLCNLRFVDFSWL